ncbi:hypothetical protein F1609_18945 [Massilia sp. CCM 8693]|uniref:SnoaL-like domain-containing protein n=2 Tax=Massilia aquatica TaxID=2609000 RepID=A0ABX0MCB1_9BURK|nr:hypothetical protein [Massilia aquatica]
MAALDPGRVSADHAHSRRGARGGGAAGPGRARAGARCAERHRGVGPDGVLADAPVVTRGGRLAVALNLPIFCQLDFLKEDIVMTYQTPLSTSDRFEIFEQLNLHQRYIDNDASLASAQTYIGLYWPEAEFSVKDIRENVFRGVAGLKQLYDYAHSVFPLHLMRHALGTFVIDGGDNVALVEWNWIVTWKAEKEGVVSTGTYTDRFEKRNGVWKCLARASNVDPNWPADLFQPWVDQQETTFKAS